MRPSKGEGCGEGAGEEGVSGLVLSIGVVMAKSLPNLSINTQIARYIGFALTVLGSVFYMFFGWDTHLFGAQPFL